MVKYHIIIGDFNNDPPKPHEISTAKILTDYFRADVLFLRPDFGKTPDFLINGEKWELKSPTGNARNTISNNLRHARHQSSKIILDLSRCGFTDERAISRAKDYLKKYPGRIKNVIIITKHKKVLMVYVK